MFIHLCVLMYMQYMCMTCYIRPVHNNRLNLYERLVFNTYKINNFENTKQQIKNIKAMSNLYNRLYFKCISK